ncbi:cytochrome P450 [Nocardia sp. NPDC059180]|uniref:cytochrome P450 n=1 Tax=Nocardia sp. NPDC059180 TaxID=3346761 RepID=UPI0036B8F6CC
MGRGKDGSTLAPKLRQSAFQNTWQTLKDPNTLMVRGVTELGNVFRVGYPHMEATVFAGREVMDELLRLEQNGALIAAGGFRAFREQFDAEHFIADSDGDMHAVLRRRLARGHSSHAADPEKLVGAVDFMVERWIGQESIDLMPELRRLFVCQASATMVRSNDAVDMTDTLFYVSSFLLRVSLGHWPKLVLAWPPYRAALRRVMAYITELADTLLAESSDSGQPPLATALVKLYRSGGISRNELILSLFGPFIGGADTSTSTIAIALRDILERPDLHAAVRAEAMAYFDGRPCGVDPLAAMPHLWSALQESMRLNPVAPAVVRRAARDFEFRGFQIREGSMVFIATTASHQSEEHFPDPTAFIADRFIDVRASNRTGYAPFGFGRRECIAKNWAKIQALLCVARLLATCELAFVGNPGESLRMTTFPPRTPKGLRMSVQPIKSAAG